MNEMPRSDGENRIASFALSPKRLQQHPGGADEEEEEEEKEEEREKQRPSNLRLGLPPRPPPIDETNLAKSPPRLPIKFIPQQAKHAHLRPRRDSPAPLHRNLQHSLRRHDGIHNALLQSLLPRPFMRFQQHFPCRRRREFQTE
jgi:hypothetical protein